MKGNYKVAELRKVIKDVYEEHDYKVHGSLDDHLAIRLDKAIPLIYQEAIRTLIDEEVDEKLDEVESLKGANKHLHDEFQKELNNHTRTLKDLKLRESDVSVLENRIVDLEEEIESLKDDNYKLTTAIVNISSKL